jgi:uncharacterized phiE125 gp8 family phage protein
MTEGPTPVSLAELKAYLRIETDLEDGVLATLLRAAVGQVEGWLGGPLLQREVQQRAVAVARRVRLVHEPVVRVESVATIAEDGSETPLTEDRWSVARMPGGAVDLCLVDDPDAELLVRYRAGTAEDWNGVPEAVRLSVLRVAGHAYGNRDGSEDPGIAAGVRQLLSPYRRTRIA